jgi:hypothetical protein
MNKPAPPAEPALPALQSVSFVGVIGGEAVGVGDIIYCDPAVRRGIVRRHPHILAAPQVFHRIKATMGSKFEER